MANALLARPTTAAEPMQRTVSWWSRVAPVLLALGGAYLAGRGAVEVSAPITSDYGLVAALPPMFWVGFALLNLAIGAQLARAVVRRADLVVTLGLLVVVLYGAAAFATGTPRTEVAWRHLGVTRALLGNGSVNPFIDGYFNWPGFFGGLGAILRVTQVPPVTLALVAPVLNGLLWMLGVCLVVRALTPHAHHMWLAAWLFTLFNWIDQDYLSPQAFAYYLYLVVAGLLLSTLAARPGRTLRGAVAEHGPRLGWTAWWHSRTPVDPDPRRRVVALWTVVLLSVVILVSHQLTPFFLIGAVALLSVTGRCWTPRLVPVLGALLTIWLCTGASTYLAGHPVLFQQSADQVAAAGVAARVQGSVGHLHVVQARVGMTLLVLALAGLGILLRWRAGDRDFRPVLLMGFPLLMIPVQSYGGEMVMRATLFALPFAAYYAAVPFLRTGRRREGRGTGAGPGQRVSATVLVLAAVAGVGVVTARYGNATFDTFTDDELTGVRELYRLAPAGATLVTSAHPTPWKYRDYLTYQYLVLTEQCPPTVNSDECYQVVVDHSNDQSAGGLVMLTRSADEALRVQGEPRSWSVAGVRSAMVHDPQVVLVYENPDVQIYRVPSTDRTGE